MSDTLDASPSSDTPGLADRAAPECGIVSDQGGGAAPSDLAPDLASASVAGSQLAQFLPYQLSVASNAVSDLIAERYRERFGLKILEWRVMAVLGDRSGVRAKGGLTQRELTQATLTDKVAVNRACKALETRGLIARAPNEADGRSHLMVLTPAGWAIHQEVLPLALETEAELLADFSASDQQQLRAMLDRLRRKVERLA